MASVDFVALTKVILLWVFKRLRFTWTNYIF